MARRAWSTSAISWFLLAVTLPASAQAPGRADQSLVVPADQLLRFGVDNDNLVVETEVDVSAGEQSYRIEGLTGEATLKAYARTRQRQLGASVSILFNHATAAKADGSQTLTSVQIRSGYVGISRTVINGPERHWLTFSQSRYRRGGEGDTQVSLQIRGTREGDVLVNRYVSAPTWTQLLHDHPLECAQYLAPIFRDLKQEGSVFGVSPEVAAQVFADAISPPGEQAQKVVALVGNLADSDYRKRSAALADLQQMGATAARSLQDQPKYNFSPEQNARLDYFLSAFETLSSDRISELRHDQDFLMRCIIYCEDSAVRQSARDELAKLIGKPVAMDPQGDRAARAGAIAKLREEMSPKTE